MAQDPGEHRFAGVTVPDPQFAGDDGGADPGLATALSAYAASGDPALLVAGLRGRRLMVPLVAVLDEEELGETGLRQEKSSHMAIVSLVAADGRRALLAFTSVAAMAAWDPAARGVPANADRVAAAALDDSAQAVLLDLAGPTRTLVEGAALHVVAGGTRTPYDDASLVAAVARATRDVPGLRSASTAPGQDGTDLLVLVEPEQGADPMLVGRAVAVALASEPVVVAACPGGFDVGLTG